MQVDVANIEISERALLLMKMDFVATMIHYGMDTQVARDFGKEFIGKVKSAQPVLVLREALVRELVYRRRSDGSD